MKRQRGRGRKPGGHHHHQHHNGNQPNRTMESSGPEVKVRGPAAHIFERYMQLARDAAGAGDRVLSENYLQHADHYFRLVRAMQPAAPLQAGGDRFSDGSEFEGDDDMGGEGDDRAGEPVGAAAMGDDQPDVEFPQGQQQPSADRDGDFRRRRGRRSRFRPGGEEGAGEEPREAREGGERPERTEPRSEPQARAERPERRERQPRERDREEGGQEGFSHGPKPAFLGSD